MAVLREMYVPRSRPPAPGRALEVRPRDPLVCSRIDNRTYFYRIVQVILVLLWASIVCPSRRAQIVSSPFGRGAPIGGAPTSPVPLLTCRAPPPHQFPAHHTWRGQRTVRASMN
eukprot:1390153-Prymnesium_polylepis.1